MVIMQEGLTSLHLASWKGHKEVVELLLDGGADVDKADLVYNISDGFRGVSVDSIETPFVPDIFVVCIMRDSLDSM